MMNPVIFEWMLSTPFAWHI